MRNEEVISRSALRKAVNDFFDNSFKGIVSSDLIKYAKAVDDFIDNAPTVEPCTDCCESMKQAISEFNANYRKKGKWIGDTDYESCQGNYEAYKCSECGYGIDWRKHHQLMCQDKIPEEYREYYCPHCGADMRGDV